MGGWEDISESSNAPHTFNYNFFFALISTRCMMVYLGDCETFSLCLTPQEAQMQICFPSKWFICLSAH